MGKLREAIAFLNVEEVPTEKEMNHYYHYIYKTPEIMNIRKRYRSDIKKEYKDLFTKE